MKALTSIVMAGALALGVAGCREYVGSADVGSANGYSCKQRDKITYAIKGDKEAEFRNYDGEKIIQYDNMTRDEALTAIDGCVAAFQKLDAEKK